MCDKYLNNKGDTEMSKQNRKEAVKLIRILRKAKSMNRAFTGRLIRTIQHDNGFKETGK